MINWTEKYRPKKFEEIKGQNLAIEKIKSFLKYFGTSKKAMLLHGGPGTGKTTLAIVAASENNAELFELNASDLRNKDKLKSILRPAIEQKSLVKKNKIILVDEVDGISTVDRGGVSELLSLLELSNYPIVMTANNAWGKKLSDLRKKVELVQMKEIDYKIVKEVLIDLTKKENLIINEDILTALAVRARGDLRAAINDLQTISKLEDPSETIFYERNKEIDIFNVLKAIFKQQPNNQLLSIFDSLNMEMDEIILWIESNIPLEYKGEELARAYELLGKVDLFKGRIYKQQYWRFLVYMNIFLTYGICSSKRTPKVKFVTYKRPTRVLKIWMNNQRTEKKKSISKKYALKVHVGEKRALSEFPIIKQIINSNPEIAKELKLSEEELEYLKS